MNRKTRVRELHRISKRRGRGQGKNRKELLQLLNWFLPEAAAFGKDEFHGNVRWAPRELAGQALIWTWAETKHVTDAYEHSTESCAELGWKQIAKSYTSLLTNLTRYRETLTSILRDRLHEVAEEVGGRYFATNGWVLMGFDGSRVDAPRTVSNEQALCAPNYGKGSRAKYGKKKSKGMRRVRNQQSPPYPQAPQAWVTMIWHMGLRLPWTWRSGPSNSSERDHVEAMLREDEFPKNTLFCGDAGFTGYPLWSAIILSRRNFVVRVGANVSLLSETVDFKKLKDQQVLCWPKGQMESGKPPLRLRLVRVRIGKLEIWLLTSVLDPKRLKKNILFRFTKRVGESKWKSAGSSKRSTKSNCVAETAIAC